MNDTKIKISACLVIYNDGKLLSRCLDSIKGVVDEIIIFHDGPCYDQAESIAKEYGAQFIVAPRVGVAEPIRPLSYALASGEWILQIDADEYLSEDLKLALPKLVNNSEIDAYEFIWPIYNGKKYLTKNWPYKRCLFRRDKMSFLGLPNYIVEVSGNVRRLALVLEHKPDYNNYSFEIFKKKWLAWAHLQAEFYLKDFPNISKFQYKGNEWPNKMSLRRDFPLLILPFDAFIVFVKTLFPYGYRKGAIFFKIAFMLACFRAASDWYLYKKQSITEVYYDKTEKRFFKSLLKLVYYNLPLKYRRFLKKLYHGFIEKARCLAADWSYYFIWPLNKKRSYDDLNFFEKKIFSQHGEDGIIKKIFDTIGTTNKFCVEFGVEDGRECNTRYLIEKGGWKYLHMDIDNYGLSTIKKERITRENINDLFIKYNVPKNFDLLSIDIDYNDYWVWEAIGEFYPRIVVIEYNASIQANLSKVVPYQADFSGDGTNFFGASLLALKKLGDRKGYSLLVCESFGANAFFIRKEEVKNYFLIKDLELVYKPPRYGQKINGVYVGHRYSDRKMLEV